MPRLREVTHDATALVELEDLRTSKIPDLHVHRFRTELKIKPKGDVQRKYVADTTTDHGEKKPHVIVHYEKSKNPGATTDILAGLGIALGTSTKFIPLTPDNRKGGDFTRRADLYALPGQQLYADQLHRLVTSPDAYFDKVASVQLGRIEISFCQVLDSLLEEPGFPREKVSVSHGMYCPRRYKTQNYQVTE